MPIKSLGTIKQKPWVTPTANFSLNVIGLTGFLSSYVGLKVSIFINARLRESEQTNFV